MAPRSTESILTICKNFFARYWLFIIITGLAIVIIGLYTWYQRYLEENSTFNTKIKDILKKDDFEINFTENLYVLFKDSEVNLRGFHTLERNTKTNIITYGYPTYSRYKRVSEEYAVIFSKIIEFFKCLDHDVQINKEKTSLFYETAKKLVIFYEKQDIKLENKQAMKENANNIMIIYDFFSSELFQILSHVNGHIRSGDLRHILDIQASFRVKSDFANLWFYLLQHDFVPPVVGTYGNLWNINTLISLIYDVMKYSYIVPTKKDAIALGTK